MFSYNKILFNFKFGLFSAIAVSSYATAHADQKYIVLDQNYDASNVSIYTANPTDGSLTEILGSPYTLGTNCHPDNNGAVTPNGLFWYVPTDNCGIYGLRFDPSTTTMSLISSTPYLTGGYLPFIDPTGNYLFAVGKNSIQIYTIEPFTGNLTYQSTTSITGAKSVTFSNSGSLVFVLETNTSTKLESFSFDTSAFTLTSTGTPTTVSTNKTFLSKVQQTNDHCLYTIDWNSNRVWTATYTTSGSISLVGSFLSSGGNNPNDITVDSTQENLYVLNQGGSIEQFSINSANCALSAAGNYSVGAHTEPISAQWLMVGSTPYIYLDKYKISDNLQYYSIDTSTGALIVPAQATYTSSTGSTGPSGTGGIVVGTVND